MSVAKGLFGFIAGLGISGTALVTAVSLAPHNQKADVPIAQAVVEDTNVVEKTSEPEAEESGDPEQVVVVEKPEQVEEPEQAEEPVATEEEVAETESPTLDVAEKPEPEKPEEPAVEGAEPETVTEKPVIEAETLEAEKPSVEDATEETLQAAATPEAEAEDITPTVETPATTKEPSVSEQVTKDAQVALNTAESAVIEQPKKFNLPTITTDEPIKEEAAIEEPAEEPEKTGITIGKKPSSNLPTITPDTPKPKVEKVDTAEDVKDVVDSDLALELYATGFESSNKPLLGMILRDIGGKGLTVKQLKALNVPITIAIPVDDKDASARALEYSAAGFEVIAMASDGRNAALNIATNSGQITDALDLMFNTVPNAIGLLDSTQAILQKNSRTSGVVVDRFVETGHGLITYAKGLNSVDRVARAEGVRTAKVARLLDANSENKAIMIQYLDRVSLEAGRDGSVVVLGTTAKATVATIAGWLLSTKGQRVMLAPASAVLLGK